MNAPNVALFPSAFAPQLGGVEELSRRLAIELRRRGSDTVVLTHRHPSDLPSVAVVDRVPVRRIRFRFPELRVRHLLGYLVGTTSARRSVRTAMIEHRSEVIHVQCVSNNAYYALRAAKAGDLPLVASLQGELTMDAARAYQQSPVLRRTWRELLTQADVVTGCSQQVVDEAISEYGPALADKAQVVRNGIDLAAVRAAPRIRRERPYVFAIGRFVVQKGFDVLISAFGMVADEFPNHDLVIAGDGAERENLKALAVGKRVEFLGGVPSERAFGLYKGASVFVLASRHEPQGIVVIEAMAAGTPVLATAVGGVPETVHHEKNGLLVVGSDVEAMAAGLRRVLSDPESARMRAMQASVDVEEYQWTRITDQYERCYEQAKTLHRGR